VTSEPRPLTKKKSVLCAEAAEFDSHLCALVEFDFDPFSVEFDFSLAWAVSYFDLAWAVSYFAWAASYFDLALAVSYFDLALAVSYFDLALAVSDFDLAWEASDFDPAWEVSYFDPALVAFDFDLVLGFSGVEDSAKPFSYPLSPCQTTERAVGIVRSVSFALVTDSASCFHD